MFEIPKNTKQRFTFPSFVHFSSGRQEKDIVLKSQFRTNNSFHQVFHVVLREKLIEFNSADLGNYQMAIQLENKFSIEDNILEFSRDGDFEFSLIFMSHDIDAWRKELSKRLCQKIVQLPFRIKKRIAVQNLSAIYLADQENPQKCMTQSKAVKTFRKSTLESKIVFQDLKNEIEVMKELKHPSICRLLNIYESGNSYYICMPHYEGGTLMDRHMQNPFSFLKIKNIIRQILSGLSYLHKRGITHRDIKPQNILLKNYESSQVAIIDFGLATFLKNTERVLRKCGTPGYIAPQIFKCSSNSLINQKCDVFSTGILFYWLLTNKLPYNAKTQDELKKENYTLNFNSKQHTILKKYPNQVGEILQKMLKRDPSSRISADQALKFQLFSLQEQYSQKTPINEIYNHQRQESKLN